MSNKQILEHASAYFKSNFPKLEAEAIICFLVFMDLGDGASVGDVARGVGMTEPGCYHFLTQLTGGSGVAAGVGLVSFENAGGGKTLLHMTDLGQSASDAVQQSFG
ncbi:MAG: hypothetical protein COB37_07010 [Kordiimonadales bacterium]|nr:MAG: hypothetical protein COB37_07010 [Kordiimonadales bacterium]